MKTVHSQLNSSTEADEKTDLTHVRVFILNNSFSKCLLLLSLCVTIVTNLTNRLLINYTRISSAFNKLSENIFFLYFNSYYYGCGVRSLTDYSRILIPDKEWDLLGHILVPK